MMAEAAGTLDERVVIERWQTARDDAGDDVGQWVAVDSVFAAVQPDGPAPRGLVGEARRSARRWQVRLRDRDDLDLMVRLRWRGRLLAVRSVDRDVRRRDFATLWCEAA